jgi:hypothetical protein
MSDRWNRFIEEQGLNRYQAASLRKELMRDRNMRLAETFAHYASQRLPKSFWDDPWNEWVFDVTMAPDGNAQYTGGHYQAEKRMRDFIPSDRAILHKALKKSYHARSGFVHEGGRTIDFISEIVAFATGAQLDGTRALQFGVLRSVLRELIRVEVEEHSSPLQLPPLALKRPDSHAT